MLWEYRHGHGLGQEEEATGSTKVLDCDLMVSRCGSLCESCTLYGLSMIVLKSHELMVIQYLHIL